MGRAAGEGLKGFYKGKIEELELLIKDKTHNLRRLEAQRNELNTQGKRCPRPLSWSFHSAVITTWRCAGVSLCTR